MVTPFDSTVVAFAFSLWGAMFQKNYAKGAVRQSQRKLQETVERSIVALSAKSLILFNRPSPFLGTTPSFC